MQKKKIALVCGGYSKEDVISLKSAQEVAKYISGEKYEVYKIVISRDGWYYQDDEEKGSKIEIDKNDFSLLLPEGKVYFEVAYNMIHGTPGEDGLLQGYFEMIGLPYTGCDASVSALTFNKAFCNAVVSKAGVKTAHSMLLCQGDGYDVYSIASTLGFPCFVKPNAGGSSIGMSKVKELHELAPAIEKAFQEDDQVLIEQYIKGREFSCGLIRERNEMLVFPITEIVPEKEFFDYEAKYKGLSKELTPAPIPENIAKAIGGDAQKVYRALHCKGVVRCDFIWEEESGTLYFLEVNTVPGQSEQSIVPQQVRCMGWTMEEFYEKMIQLCLQESSKK